jgi:hypothetical protein
VVAWIAIRWAIRVAQEAAMKLDPRSRTLTGVAAHDRVGVTIQPVTQALAASLAPGDGANGDLGLVVRPLARPSISAERRERSTARRGTQRSDASRKLQTDAPV